MKYILTFDHEKNFDEVIVIIIKYHNHDNVNVNRIFVEVVKIKHNYQSHINGYFQWSLNFKKELSYLIISKSQNFI